MKKIHVLVSLFISLSFTGMAQDSTAYTDYYGTYKLPEGSDVSEVTIVWLDSSLNITSDMGNAKMDKLDVDSFHMDYEDGAIKFVRDSATHKVSALIIYVQGTIIEATKEEKMTTGTSWLRIEYIRRIKYYL
jgi:hypothetical protein